jgi:hypothetical protein
MDIASLQIPVEYDVLKAAKNNLRSPGDWVARAAGNGDILRIRRGLYYPAPTLRDAPEATSWLVANQLYGPSYVSCQSLLAYYGIIPEAVFAITSCAMGRARELTTSIGRFVYGRVPAGYFSAGLTLERGAVVATPVKALCDILLLNRSGRIQSMREMRAFLLDDLRVDPDALFEANSLDDAMATLKALQQYKVKSHELELMGKVLQSVAQKEA